MLNIDERRGIAVRRPDEALWEPACEDVDVEERLALGHQKKPKVGSRVPCNS